VRRKCVTGMGGASVSIFHMDGFAKALVSPSYTAVQVVVGWLGAISMSAHIVAHSSRRVVRAVGLSLIHRGVTARSAGKAWDSERKMRLGVG